MMYFSLKKKERKMGALVVHSSFSPSWARVQSPSPLINCVFFFAFKKKKKEKKDGGTGGALLILT